MGTGFDKTMRIDLDSAFPHGTAEPDSLVTQSPASAEGARAWFRPAVGRTTPFYQLLESAYDAIFITTRQGVILECNERAHDFFRANDEQLIGRPVVQLISGAGDALIRTISENLERNRFTLVEARCKRLDATLFPAEIAVNQVALDEQGELCFLVRDVTVRTDAQNALKDAVERLQAHDRARMEFVSNVSHELRTPLTSMIYAVSNMLRGVVGPMPEKAVRYLERLQSDCQRLLGTVNDILDLRQIENHSLVLTRSVSPLGPIIFDAVESLQVQADAKAIRIRSELPSRELFCCCDVQKMARVMLNIIGNAIKFTPAQGEIVVSLKPHPKKKRFLLITCRDTGLGIPKELLPKISQRYFRVGDHVTGSGLGLAISREIVELHGGEIHFESPVPGTTCGTEVSVLLPVAGKPLVVVYSEDETSAASLYEKVTFRGYEAVRMSDPQAALDFCAKRLPSIFIFDTCTTRGDVRELILRLREEQKTKRMPVIVLGTKVIQRTEVELYRHFGVFYATCPVSDEDFAHHLALAVLGKLR